MFGVFCAIFLAFYECFGHVDAIFIQYIARPASFSPMLLELFHRLCQTNHVYSYYVCEFVLCFSY